MKRESKTSYRDTTITLAIETTLDQYPSFIVVEGDPRMQWQHAEGTEEHFRAAFLLAGFPKEMRFNKLVNRYGGYERLDPWWLVETKYGLIEIGWRNRVINIDWSRTTGRTVVTDDNVTKSETHVHAYSMAEAVTYLSALRRFSRGTNG